MHSEDGLWKSDGGEMRVNHYDGIQMKSVFAMRIIESKSMEVFSGPWRLYYSRNGCNPFR